MHGDGLALSLTLAVFLDMWLGDPLWLPHPVRWMGSAITWAEPRFRLLPLGPKSAGGLMAVSLVGFAWVTSWAVVRGAFLLHPVVGIGIQALFLYTCISARELSEAAISVGRTLEQSGIAQGRKTVSMIVGREVETLDENGVCRAAVETVAENLVDGVVSPLFFAVIGGAPLAMAYKMVNTLDSMVGYKNDRYRHFGRFAARMDDVANFIPARIAVPFIALASLGLNGRHKEALRTAFRDGRLHASPNAGYPEAAFSGALGLWLGGSNTYHGKLVDKPVIGKKRADTRPIHIPRACRLMLASAVLVFMGAAVLMLFSGWVR